MSVPKIKTLLTVCTLLFLTACGQPLSEREVVRAVFFTRQQGEYSVCLLLADQHASEETVSYKTASARAATAAQALHFAEDSLPGQPYYGLLDLAALPPDCDLETARELGTLLYDKAQPAPELSVFLLDSTSYSRAEDAAPLYEAMNALATQYRLHCGLQQLFTQKDGCSVPVYRPENGYGFALLTRESEPWHLSGLSAQLAAALCGQTDRLSVVYNGGQAVCRTQIFVTASESAVQLHLRDTEFRSLTQISFDLQGCFIADLQQTFTELLRENFTENRADFFHLRFRYANLYGTSVAPPTPALEILFE